MCGCCEVIEQADATEAKAFGQRGGIELPRQVGELGALSIGRPGQAALTRSDPRAIAAVRLWLECYGAFAGDLAMHWLAYGGVYLAGGIAAKLLPHCDRQAFVDAANRASKEES